MKLLFFGVFILTSSLLADDSGGKELRPSNGWSNNRASHSSGIAGSKMYRKFEPRYSDGVGSPGGHKRPSSRSISSILMSGRSGKPSIDNKTVFFAFFSEFVWGEIASSTREELAGCPREYFNIPIPLNDRAFNASRTIPYLRSQFDDDLTGKSVNYPREQLTSVTSYIDGSSIYGNERLWTDQLRLRRKNCPLRSLNSNIFTSQTNPSDCRGELESYNDQGLLPPLNWKGLPLTNQPSVYDDKMQASSRLHLTGLKHINENPFLLTIGTIWFRHHNWLARKIRDKNQDWSEERVFQAAKDQNIATFQNIVLYEWLPILLGRSAASNLPEYSGYKPSLSLGVSNTFYTVATSYTKTLIPPGVYHRSRRNNLGECVFCRLKNTTSFKDVKQTTQKILRLCNTYWNSQNVIKQTEVEDLVMGMSSQLAEKEDAVFVEDLNDFYHGTLHFSRRDIIAETIQRGRDHGLTDYNSARAGLSLATRMTFREINPELFNSSEGSKLLKDLEELFLDVNDLDVFVGAMLETKTSGAPGEIIDLLLREQFMKIRDADRFWFENPKNRMLSGQDIAEIRALTIRDVILRVFPSLNGSTDLGESLFVWSFDGDDSCGQPVQLTSDMLEDCIQLKTFDYFTTSNKLWFTITFIFVGLVAAFIYLLAVAECRKALQQKSKISGNQLTARKIVKSEKGYASFEVLSDSTNVRPIEIILLEPYIIRVMCFKQKKILRDIDLTKSTQLEILRSENGNQQFISILINQIKNYDLLLDFTDIHLREHFYSDLLIFLSKNIPFTQHMMSENQLFKKTKTKAKQDMKLQEFFQQALTSALSMERIEDTEELSFEEKQFFQSAEITREEFAELLDLTVDNDFVQNIFNICKKSEDCKITFKDFCIIIFIFVKGSAEDKARTIFNMYDLNNRGKLSIPEFKNMLKSLINLGGFEVDENIIEIVAEKMLAETNVRQPEYLTVQDFLWIMKKHESELTSATLFNENAMLPNIKSQFAQKIKKRKSEKLKDAIPFFQKKTNLEAKKYENYSTTRNLVEQNKTSSSVSAAISKLNEYYSRHIFIMNLYILLTVGIFAKAFWAVISNQGSGLLSIGGVTVAIARASGAALSFNFSSLLLTMSRNTLTFFRETFLQRYIPFDAAVDFHVVIAWIAMFFTVIHVVAHGVNFYEISTQSPFDMSCFFPDICFSSNFVPNFVFWCFQTITGITGVILCIILIIMYVFAMDFVRKSLHQWFRFTHYVGFILVYVFTVLHGSGMLIQVPSFQNYFLGFAILYTLDRLYSMRRSSFEIEVLKSQLLPSNVTYLEIKKPQNFVFKAGQWVKIACSSLSKHEYHPFTISSAPNEKNLTLHIRAVGPWTKNIREIYSEKSKSLPKIFLDGPFGEGHQDWYKYKVAVLFGGGIGVTPFASILKDIVYSFDRTSDICKAVHFVWITRDQKQYEWLMDILRLVEVQTNSYGKIHIHIFITQMAQKFDLRTTMLYICEKRFHKVSRKSLFTGLRAKTHFGRPNIQHFLSSIKENYSEVKKFGIFSCGPPPMTYSVDAACFELNTQKGAIFSHHFENF